MSDPASIAATPEVTALLEPPAVLKALADPVRLDLVRLLAQGGAGCVNDLADRLGRPPDCISKHLRVLRGARIIRAVTPPGADGRKQFHELPTLFRTRDAAGKTVLDFGRVLVRLD